MEKNTGYVLAGCQLPHLDFAEGHQAEFERLSRDCRDKGRFEVHVLLGLFATTGSVFRINFGNKSSSSPDTFEGALSYHIAVQSLAFLEAPVRVTKEKAVQLHIGIVNRLGENKPR